MRIRIMCPSCTEVFEADMKQGYEELGCPYCRTELEVVALFNDTTSGGLNIGAKAVEKKTKKLKAANYRIVRYNGHYMVEVLDKPVGHWYVAAANIKTLREAVGLVGKYEEEPLLKTKSGTPTTPSSTVSDTGFTVRQSEENEGDGQ